MDIKSIIVRTNPPMEKPQRAEVRDGVLFGDCHVETIAAALAGAPCEVVVARRDGARHRFAFTDGQVQHGDLELYETLDISAILGQVVSDPAKHDDPVGNEIVWEEVDREIREAEALADERLDDKP